VHRELITCGKPRSQSRRAEQPVAVVTNHLDLHALIQRFTVLSEVSDQIQRHPVICHFTISTWLVDEWTLPDPFHEIVTAEGMSDNEGNTANTSIWPCYSARDIDWQR
jgi:hypothetical protein